MLFVFFVCLVGCFLFFIKTICSAEAVTIIALSNLYVELTTYQLFVLLSSLLCCRTETYWRSLALYEKEHELSASSCQKETLFFTEMENLFPGEIQLFVYDSVDAA